MSAQVLTVSSKGQIAIPISIRKQLSIDAGDKMVAYTSGDVIMLKMIKLPSAEEFSHAMDAASAWAESVGYKQEDVSDVISNVRRKKHDENSN